jgi:hypothetical protein
MTLEQLGILSEIVSAIAIIITLIYLSIQIRDSARASKSAAVTDATTAMQAFYLELGSNPATAKLFLDGLTNPENLSREAQYQHLMMLHSFFLGIQRCFFLAQVGTLDVGLRDSIGTALHAASHLPGMHLYWRQRKGYFQPEFIEWVEGIFARDPYAEMDAYRDHT